MKGTVILSGQRGRWLLAALVIAIAMPFLPVSTPMLIDLPGHLQRYHVQAEIGRSAGLALYYDYAWRFLPNLGVDLLIIPIGALIGVEAGTRLILALITALGAAGMLWTAREAHGRVPVTSLFALPLVFAYPLSFGFLNSCLSISLALLALAWWLRLTRTGQFRLRAIAIALIAPLLMLCHIIGYGVLGLAAGGAIIGLRRAEGAEMVAAVRKAIIACLPLAWPLVLLILWRTGGSATTEGWLNWQVKGMWLATLLRQDTAWLDLASALVVYMVAALPWLARRHFRYTPALAVPALLLWSAAMILPTRLIGSEMASVRLIPVACAISILAVGAIERPPRWLGWAALLFITVRLTTITLSLTTADVRAAKQLAALDHVRRGARIIAINAIDCERQWQPPRLQALASFATVRRDAYVNSQFDTTEGQLLKTRLDQWPALRAFPQSVMRKGHCPRWADRPEVGESIAHIPWADIDYLWLINVEAPLRPAKRGLHIVWQSGDSILYSIDATR